jgi:hypothetical protein
MIRTCAAAVLTVALLVGCSSEPEPQPLPPLPSAAPSASPLPLPPEAAAETPQGAAAFTRYYFDALNAAFATGDATQVKILSHPECDACNELISAIREEPAAGERISGGDYRVLFAESPPVASGDVVVEVRYALTEARVTRPDGSLIRTTAANPGINAQVRLIRQGTGWIVRGFRNVP